MALEDHRAIEARPLHVLAGGDDVAFARLIEPGEDVEDRRLAAAGVADHAGELAFLDAEPEVLEHREVAGTRRTRESAGSSLRR